MVREGAADSTETQALRSLHAHCKKQGRNCSNRLGPCSKIQVLKSKRDLVNGSMPGCSALGRKAEDHRLGREVMGGDLEL